MYEIGDTIRPLDDTGEFTISRVAGNFIYAEDEHGFDHEFLENEIVLVRHNLLAGITTTHAKSKFDVDRGKVSKAHKSNKKKQWLEVDLHAGILLGNTTGWSNHEILTEQLKVARQTVGEARAKGYNFCVLIHGKGSGRLKEELLKMLSHLNRVEFYDADYKSYSGGATEVKLF